MTENIIRRAPRKGRAALGTGIKELASRGIPGIIELPIFKAGARHIAKACNAHGKLARESAATDAQIEEYRRLAFKEVKLSGADISTYVDGFKAHKCIGVPLP